jgi:cytidylate kinase
MERARRRRKELMEKGISIGLMAIMKNLKKRDRIDSLREVSPLIRVPEAIYIDTTRLTIEEEVDLLIELIRRI